MVTGFKILMALDLTYAFEVVQTIWAQLISGQNGFFLSFQKILSVLWSIFIKENLAWSSFFKVTNKFGK